ncbi:MAG: PVC-type heme-binding CxxCH protein [Planctomycetota bacterium]|jgi:putative membrane-bound dehydrogenase-like protein
MWQQLSVRTIAVLMLLSRAGLAAEPDPEVEILQPGVKLTLVAEHPQLATPTGIDVDAQGRIWAVATHTHFRPDDYDGPEHDEILVFSDADGDGKAELRQVFYEATVATMDLELGPDGWVYLAERDRILRIRDTDGDGKADEEQDLAVLETEADYPHNGLAGLAWHPGGDLIFSLGENYAKPWTLTGTDGTSDKGTGEGGVFRCTPDGKKLHRIARGFWNPFGICVREDGEIFAAENDPGSRPPCRLLHVVEGGDYGYQRLYGNEAHHPFVCWNGELRGTLPMLHPSGEAPCSVLPLGDGVIATTWTDHRIDFYPLRREGASFASSRVVLARGGNNFRPVCMTRLCDLRGTEETVTAGSVSGTATFYFTDWVFVSYQLHGKGRLWRLDVDLDDADWLQPERLEPPNDSARLADALRNGERDVPLRKVHALAVDKDPFLARAALTALARRATHWKPADVEGWSERDRVSAAQALRIAATERGDVVDVDSWVPTLLGDESSEVRYEALRWIANAQLTQFLPDVEQMLERSEVDFLLFEAVLAARNTLTGNPAAGVRDVELLLRQVKNQNASPQLRAYALRLLPTTPRVAKEGQLMPPLAFPKGLTVELLRSLFDVRDDELSRDAIRTLAGNPNAVSVRVLTEVASGGGWSAAVRAEAIAGLAAVANEHVGLLVKLASSDERSLREEALRALRRANLSSEYRTKLGEIAQKFPESADLIEIIESPTSLRRKRPDLRDVDAWQKHLAAIQSPPDPAAGERVFRHSQIALCTRCHRHEGRGNVVGPDLSQVGRPDDRHWLLESILQPNLKVAPEYRARTLILTDGRVFTGIHLRTGGGGDVETLRDNNGQERRFPRAEIEASHEVMTSLMPEGLPMAMTDRELRDLIAFLERGSD